MVTGGMFGAVFFRMTWATVAMGNNMHYIFLLRPQRRQPDVVVVACRCWAKTHTHYILFTINNLLCLIESKNISIRISDNVVNCTWQPTLCPANCTTVEITGAARRRRLRLRSARNWNTQRKEQNAVPGFSSPKLHWSLSLTRREWKRLSVFDGMCVA